MSRELSVVRPVPPVLNLPFPFPRTVILAATQPDVAALSRVFSPEKAQTTQILMSRMFVTQEAVVAGPFIGAPYAAMLMEILAAMGGTRFLVLGWAGALVPSLGFGDLVVVEEAFPDLGLARLYGGNDRPQRPSPGVTDSLLPVLSKAGHPFVKGAIWSTDAIFRETPEKIDRFRALGAVAVEMEIAGLFAVAAHHGVDAAGLCVISDSVAGFSWKKGFSQPEFKRGRMAAVEALHTLCLQPFPNP